MKIDWITDTYKSENEDSYGMTLHGFWVMDGASALIKNNYTDEHNDVVWIVKWWNSYLESALDQLNKSLQTILNEGIDKLNADFSKYVDVEELSKLERVSSAIAIVRINGDIVECFVLGDVEILIQNISGKVNVLTDETIIQLDNEVMTLMGNNPNRENKIEYNGYTQGELDLLRNNRMTMNTETGYAILEHDKSAIKRGIFRDYPIINIDDILIVSDGYSKIYNTYYQCEQKEIISLCKKMGIRKILEMIRDIESQDGKMQKYKRLRCHDDATAVLIEFD